MTTHTEFPPGGFVREPKLVGHSYSLFPMSRSTLWAKVADGTFPAPVKLSSRITAWRVQDIQKFIASLGTSESSTAPAADVSEEVRNAG